MKNVVIVGGGLAGLISGIQLSKAGVPCILIEKKSYPLHRVCGEYISNEVCGFLQQNDLFPFEFTPSVINEFQLSSISGREAILPLEMGGFGISRFSFDHFLVKKAVEVGVTVLTDTEVDQILFSGENFSISTQAQTFEADLVIGSFGKRSKLDVSLKRAFIKKRSPYMGVKYHVRSDQPHNRISLHNFPGGYCGVSNVENGITNLCYLTEREGIRGAGSIPKLEEQLLFQNPFLKKIFTTAEFLFSKPEVINEISFESKRPVEDHILMVGDAAGMIAPLCGNGMAMAIHGAKIASELALQFSLGRISRVALEKTYAARWKSNFQNRLWRGRNIQKLFGNPVLSSLSVNLLLSSRPLANLIVKSTHGKSF